MRDGAVGKGGVSVDSVSDVYISRGLYLFLPSTGYSSGYIADRKTLPKFIAEYESE